MALASQEAQRLNHEHIGTEHVLLGLIKEGCGVGGTILKNYDLNIKILIEDILKLVPSGPDMVTTGKLPQTPITKKVIESAIDYARSLNHDYVGAEHILGGLVAEKEGIASQILVSKGFDEEKVKKDLEDLLGVSPQSEEVQEIQKPADYWVVPRENMNLVEFLRTYDRYELFEGPGKHFKILNSEGPPKVDVGKFNLEREELSFEPKNVTVMYDINNQKQIGYALDLRDIFDKNGVKYVEEPPNSKVAEGLKKPIGNIISLINRLEKRV